ncbi:MAG: hypothetical protein QNK23_07230 [Crocinitomicaceae bacterium]|nr:hypothetical protein [Crocinitomicaceae bacterium]
MERPHLNMGAGAGFKIDIMLLCDSTGSMYSAIGDVKADFIDAYKKLLAATQWDAQVGVAYYKDTTDADPYRVLASITDDDAGLQQAVNSLVPSGGGDQPEGQLFALTELSNRASSGWRPGAMRIICWFGDEYGHDPITEEGVTCTLESTANALIDKNVYVCAFSMAPTNDLNGGALNQAVQITNLTNGVSTGQYFKPNVAQAGVTEFIFSFIQNHLP